MAVAASSAIRWSSALLRARRPRDGDRPRRGPARPLYPRGGRVSWHQPGPARQLSLERHRGRCRRPLRRNRRSISPASWSISKRPASIPATAPARSRPTRSAPRSSSGSSDQTRAMALALGVVGLMNVQFAIQGEDIYVLEVNPIASRTVPSSPGHRQRHRRDRRARDGRRDAAVSRSARPMPPISARTTRCPMPTADARRPGVPWFSVRRR